MEDYVNKVFFAPTGRDQGSAGLADINMSEPYDDLSTGGIDADVEFRDCSTHVSIEFGIYAKSIEARNLKTLREVIAERRDKMNRMVDFVLEFADAYEKRLAVFEKQLDRVEKNLPKIDRKRREKKKELAKLTKTVLVD